VKTPAAIASTSDKIKLKSGKPEGFKPAVIPDARYPLGAVTPPSISFQSDIMTSLVAFHLLKGDYIKFLGTNVSPHHTTPKASRPEARERRR
jgi:hypothetical protein